MPREPKKALYEMQKEWNYRSIRKAEMRSFEDERWISLAKEDIVQRKEKRQAARLRCGGVKEAADEVRRRWRRDGSAGVAQHGLLDA